MMSRNNVVEMFLHIISRRTWTGYLEFWESKKEKCGVGKDDEKSAIRAALSFW